MGKRYIVAFFSAGTPSNEKPIYYCAGRYHHNLSPITKIPLTPLPDLRYNFCIEKPSTRSLFPFINYTKRLYLINIMHKQYLLAKSNIPAQSLTPAAQHGRIFRKPWSSSPVRIMHHDSHLRLYDILYGTGILQSHTPLQSLTKS